MTIDLFWRPTPASIIMVAMWRRRLSISLRLLFIGILFLGLVAPEWPSIEDERQELSALVDLREFDFVSWVLEALEVKATGVLGDGHRYMGEEGRKAFVLNYLDLVNEANRLQAEINAIYADPEVDQPDVASAPTQQALAKKRAEMARLQPIAESILQEQVAAILDEEGLALAGAAWPPVLMHMTPLPLVLVVSPREEIKQIYSVPLEHGLSIPEREHLEQQVYDELDRSALVVPIGGLGMYPSMIVETGSINFLTNTIAHEWTHHWLTLHPVGVRYMASPQMRTINETVASIVGDEVGARVMARFYPELVPPAVADEGNTGEALPAEPPAFDFRAEMAKTRVEVDRLLAEGKVEEAEGYMNQRQAFFVENGYLIRKLNQAYFAFYGAYADTPGATGADPVGPSLLKVRAQSPSLHAFLQTVGTIRSYDDLEALVAGAAPTGGDE